MVMRRGLPWFGAVPTMVGGSLAAHASSLVLVGAGERPESHEHSEATTAGELVVGIGVVSTLVAALVAIALFRFLSGRDWRLISPWLFFCFPPFAFSAQELSERLLNTEAAPFQAALEPRFLLGLTLQLPFALLTLVLARALLRVVKEIRWRLRAVRAGIVARRAPAILRPLPSRRPRRPAGLALGYAQRGPPQRYRRRLARA